jgi:hypothetical protein
VKLLEHRHARRSHHLLGFDLRTHRSDRPHRRPDPRHARIEHGGGEFRILRKEPVARVDGVGARGTGRGDQLPRVQISVAALEVDAGVGLGHMRGCGVRIGVHSDGADAEPPAGGEHPAGDLAAVGDQYSCDHRSPPRRRA